MRASPLEHIFVAFAFPFAPELILSGVLHEHIAAIELALRRAEDKVLALLF